MVVRAHATIFELAYERTVQNVASNVPGDANKRYGLTLIVVRREAPQGDYYSAEDLLFAEPKAPLTLPGAVPTSRTQERRPMRFWQRLRGWCSYYRKRNKHYFGPPMNGQTERIELVQQVVTRCGIERIVETGTFLANTTVWFASFGLPVMTVEINARYFGFSQARLRAHGNVTVHEGNSIDFLRSIIAGTTNHTAPTLFYLDAHWLNYLPLREEVELITANFPRSVIVVDDFEVPGDPGYRFDDYGTGKRLCLDYLLQAATPSLAIYFPRVRSEQETGARRGWATLTASSELAGVLDRLPALRRWMKD